MIDTCSDHNCGGAAETRTRLDDISDIQEWKLRSLAWFNTMIVEIVWKICTAASPSYPDTARTPPISWRLLFASIYLPSLIQGKRWVYATPLTERTILSFYPTITPCFVLSMCGGSRDDLSHFSDVHPHSVKPDSPVELLRSTIYIAGDDLSKPGISISVCIEDPHSITSREQLPRKHHKSEIGRKMTTIFSLFVQSLVVA